ncbi:MAG TPA: AAA family ATPase [Thermoanaerobaculia bacterium]|nr:AAA family ATPase [Thermoanaerobaculia bacterium]
MNSLRISEVRIQNFRLLRDVWLPLGDLTVLIGPNNSGKTAFLQALAVALGEHRASTEDLYIAPAGIPAKSFIIDLLIHPGRGEEFSEELRDLFADAIQIPVKGPEYVVLRTVGAPDTRRGGILPRRSFLKGWERTSSETSILPELKKPGVSREILELFSYNFLDARRDIVEQLQGRSTYWGKLAGALDIEDQLRSEIETSLGTLSKTIIQGSAVLEQVRSEIDRITEALTPGSPGVDIEPLPARVEDLSRGMDIRLRAPGSAAISMSRQGMGTRSLAALTVFSAFVKIRMAEGPTALTLLALEEPEAHLHPQAQRAVFDLACSIHGQRVLSTHSPYVSGIADVFDFRTFRRKGSTTQALWVPKTNAAGTPTFTPEEHEKVRRFVQHRHGEILFARLALFVEGETEEYAIPVFAEHYWKRSIHDQGISLINVEGAQSYKHFVILLEKLGIPWIILSDGDQEGVKGIAATGKALGRELDPASEVVMLPTEPKGLAFEEYLIQEGFRPQVERAIAAACGTGALEEYRDRNHGQKRKGGGLRDYRTPGSEDHLVLDFMADHKALLGQPVAQAICVEGASKGAAAIPPKVLEPFRRVDKILSGEVL